MKFLSIVKFFVWKLEGGEIFSVQSLCALQRDLVATFKYHLSAMLNTKLWLYLHIFENLYLIIQV